MKTIENIINNINIWRLRRMMVKYYWLDVKLELLDEGIETLGEKIHKWESDNIKL